MPKGPAPSLLLGRELLKPPQQSVVSICAKAALNNLRDASGRCKEGVEVGIEGGLPAGVHDAIGRDIRGTVPGHLRSLKCSLYPGEVKKRVLELQLRTRPQFFMHRVCRRHRQKPRQHDAPSSWTG